MRVVQGKKEEGIGREEKEKSSSSEIALSKKYPSKYFRYSASSYLFLLTHLDWGFLKFLLLPPTVLVHPPNELSCLVWKLQALFREK